MFGLTPYNRRNNKDVVRKNSDIESIFDGFFNDSFFPAFFGESSIRADMIDNEKEYVIKAEIPGVNKEDIKLDLRDDILTISVEHNEQANEERENYIRRERRFGSFSRSFYVDNARNEDVKAKFENGVLTINLPKYEGENKKTHRIDIQ